MAIQLRLQRQTDAALDISRDHEMVHVRQFERWGPLMGLAHLWVSLRALADASQAVPRQSVRAAGIRGKGRGMSVRIRMPPTGIACWI